MARHVAGVKGLCICAWTMRTLEHQGTRSLAIVTDICLEPEGPLCPPSHPLLHEPSMSPVEHAEAAPG